MFYMNNSSDILPYILVIGGIVSFVCCYAKALKEVKLGRLVVYRGWGDFIKASLWVLLIPYGVFSAFVNKGDGNWPSHALGVVSMAGGSFSFWRAWAGAFRYNSGTKRWLALFGRFAVTLLLVFTLAKLAEKFRQYERGQIGATRGVLLPLLIFAYAFHEFIHPMIGLRCYQSRSIVHR